MNDPFANEQIILGLALRYGKGVLSLILPALTPDKFVYDSRGEFGQEHSDIWEAISDLYLVEGKVPTVSSVANRLREETTYFSALIDMLSKRYGIYELDVQSLEEYARLVDKTGIYVNVCLHGAKLGSNLENGDKFRREVSKVERIEDWLTDQLEHYRSFMVNGSGGYKHVAEIVPEVIEGWEQIYAGKKAILLPLGMPSFIGRQLFPLGKIAVIQGWSSNGKSALTHQINLGTAIGLVADGVKGCVVINSMEETRTDLLQKYAGMLAHIDTSRFAGGKEKITRKELDKLEYWLHFVEKLPIFVDDTNLLTTSALQYQSSALHTGIHGPILQLSVDYLELLSDDVGDTEEQRLHTIFKNHLEISRRLGCSVIVISQSTVDKATSGKTWIAGPQGTRGSRGILQNTDVLLELYNPIEFAKAGIDVVAPQGLNTTQPWLLIQKYRGSNKGGHIPLGWVPSIRAFFDESIPQSIGKETLFTNLDKALNVLGIKPLVEDECDGW